MDQLVCEIAYVLATMFFSLAFSIAFALAQETLTHRCARR
jgi:uncharacterized membrane protein